MRYALILAGGSGTRLWPMSRQAQPKQLLPFIRGRSLLELALERLGGLVDPSHRLICAGQRHEEAIRQIFPDLGEEQFLGEPVGRDTLPAVGLGATVLARKDPEAVIAVIAADLIMEPREDFHHLVEQGYSLAERSPETLVTFGIRPTAPATGYGYLELGEPLEGGAFRVKEFREKPDLETARRYLQAGPEHYLWNSGMFVWRGTTLLDCIRRYEPDTYQGLEKIAASWESPERKAVLAQIYPELRSISADFAVMEPASRDPAVRVAAIPMALEWLDVSSWPTFASTCPRDEQGNALAAEKHLLLNTSNCLVASSDPEHLIAVVGGTDLLVIHTPEATLVCPADQAEAIKELHPQIRERFGTELL